MVWQHFAHCNCFVLYLTLLKYSTLHTLCSVFCTAHIAAHCKFHALLCILHCSHCSTFYIIHALFCIMRCSIATQCIFHALFCILHCSYCSTFHIFHALLCILNCFHCSTLHIPCFVLYFALLTLQHIACSMLCSVFCTSHTAVNCIFNDLLCILHCSHCSTLHIFHALLCILHCSHCSTMHIPSFALYFALLTLQYTAYFMLCSVICPAHIAVQCIFHDFFCILHCSIAAHCIFHALFYILHCSHCSTLHIFHA